MKKSNLQKLSLALGATFLATIPIMAVGTVAAAAPPPSGFTWETVVNNNDLMPGSGGQTFNSYNQPSVNAHGVVVMRARSRGGQEGGHGNGGGEGDSGGSGGSGKGEGGSGGGSGNGEGSGGGHQGGGGGNGEAKGPSHGIFLRDMAEKGRPIVRVLDRTTEVPQPNNLGTMFVETPAFPRIDIWSDTMVTRGNHQPVWEYTLDGEHTRAGTTGIYTNPGGPLITGASKLGDVREFSFFEVPEYPGTAFEVFPGAPSVTDGGIIVFKGNYSVPDPHEPMSMIGRTGVYYRQVVPRSKGKTASGTTGQHFQGDNVPNIQLVANTDTLIPNLGKCGPGTTFGSTAPPSSADGHMVFVGLDNEQNPTCGGIYLAPLAQPPGQLTKLVGLDTKVPGQGGATFNRLGEAVSYDGRFVAIWGAWGEQTKTIRLYCPEEGNQIRQDFCNNAGDFAPDLGDPDSICNGPNDACYQIREVPINQGVFVYDTYGHGKLWTVATTGDGTEFDDFVYWNYSGAPPGGGEEGDGEPPRWRSSTFLAVSQRAGATFRAAFLARRGHIDPGTHLYAAPVDGIYLAEVLGAQSHKLTSLVQTGMDGTILDPRAVDPDTNQPLRISSLALERESFRGRWLVINAAMGNEEAGWAGIYLTRMPVPPGGR